MSHLKKLSDWLERHADSEHYLFTSRDLRAFYPQIADVAYYVFLNRAVKAGYLEKLCRGLYLFKKAMPATGRLLFHAAAKLRANAFSYMSLETVLSEAGVISQIPMNSISIMTTGRSNVIQCATYGRIEFVHTTQKPTDLMEELVYDEHCKLWRASVSLALRDMKATHRSCDLIDWEIANELIRSAGQ